MTQALEPGTILRSRYKVTDLVGEGGMGAVYRAEDLRLEGRLCAIKEVRPDPGTKTEMSEQARNQFYREASILARLDHPNLPKVSDYFSEGGLEYLVMDYVSGKELRQLMEDALANGRTLPEAQVLHWADQLCSALEYLHSQEPPVLHRDIKPGNIKVTPSGTLKLVDFGLVKLLATDDSRTITVLQGRGTAQYTPLEQYGGDTGHTDVRSDIYALGATLYHLLTGKAPYDAKQRFLAPSAMPSPCELNPDISPRTDRAIMRALAMHPGDRPASITEFREELFHGSNEPDSRANRRRRAGTFRTNLATGQWLPFLLVVALLALAIYVTAFGPLTF